MPCYAVTGSLYRWHTWGYTQAYQADVMACWAACSILLLMVCMPSTMVASLLFLEPLANQTCAWHKAGQLVDLR